MKLLNSKVILSAVGVMLLAGPAIAQRTEPLEQQQHERYTIPGGVGRPPWGEDLIDTGKRMLGPQVPASPQTYFLPSNPVTPTSTQDYDGERPYSGR